MDNPNNILGNILAGTLDNTDHIGAGPDDVSLALQYSFSGFSPVQQIDAVFSLANFDNGGLRQFRDTTQLYFNGGAVESGTLAPAPTPEPATLLLLGTGAALTALGRLGRRVRAAWASFRLTCSAGKVGEGSGLVPPPAAK